MHPAESNVCETAPAVMAATCSIHNYGFNLRARLLVIL